MLRKFACAMVILGLAFGVALAEELKGVITKVDGNKISFKAAKEKEAKEYDATGAKVVTKKKDQKVEVAGGLTNEAFSKIGKGGLPATINVDGGKVTEITIAGKKKKDGN